MSDPAVAGLLGCGVMAGIGAAVNTAPVQRGDTVAVIGCGGVGCAAVAGADLAGARRVIAIDLDDRKLELARSMGATHTVNSKETDPVAAIRELTPPPDGTTGRPAAPRPDTNPRRPAPPAPSGALADALQRAGCRDGRPGRTP